MAGKRWWMAALVWVGSAVGVSAGELNVGDPAPRLRVKEFVKGEPVKELTKGNVYVVEFWATWCGPCRATIPHLTELQKEHPDVTFIGVSVYENDQKAVKPFVEEMKGKMEYRVAMDDVPEGGKRGDGPMAKDWMDAAGQDGIPTAFIVNGDGRVAWVGHPTQMDKPLKEVVAGTWDLKAATVAFKEEMAEKRAVRELRTKLVKARQSGDTKALLAVLDEGIAQHAKLEPQLGLLKFQTLAAEADSRKEALEYGRHLIKDVFGENAQALNAVAWVVVDPQKKKPADALLRLALRAAKQADEKTGHKDAGVCDTLARAYFLAGDVAKAVEVQEHALELAQGTPLEKDKGMKDRLEEYRKAEKK